MKTFRIIFLILTVLIFFACSKGEEPSSASADTEEVSKEKIEEVIILEPVQNEGLISFITGDVFLIRDNTESIAEIGDTVAVNDIIRTGEDGLCEIQIGTTAIISLKENTDFSLSTVSLKSEGNIVKVKVIAGMAAFKINKLLDKDRFTIDTPTMMFGIRGTRFLIKVIDHQTTEIAVIEGNVAVIPFEAETLFNLKETAPEELAAILEELLNIETIIEAGKEIIIKAADFAPMAEQLQKIVEEVLGYEEKTDEEKISIISQVETAVVYVEKAVKTIPEPEILAPLNKEILKPLEIRKFLSIQSLEEQKTEKKPLEYRALIINVEPVDTEIYLDEQLRGTGQISALFPLNTELNLLLMASGYEDAVDLLTISKDTPTTYNYSLEREKREILLKVEPSDAVLFLDDNELGKGNHSGLYPLGSTLVFTARRNGYNPASIEVHIGDDQQTEYILALSRGPRPFTLTVFPDDSEITIDGNSVGYGSFSGEYTFGTEIKVEVRKTGYKPLIETFILDESVPNELIINLDLVDVVLTVSVYPADAGISINGRLKGKGKTTVSFPFGSELEVAVDRKGYESDRFTLRLSSTDPTLREVRLKALPLYGRYQLGSNSLVGHLLVIGNRVVAADSEGFLLGINLEGEEEWSYDTSNRNNESAYPVRAGREILFAGTKRFVVVSPISGLVIYQKELGSLNSLPFGNKPLYTSKAIVYPEQPGLRFLDPKNFSETGFLPLPELLMTTPAILGNVIYVVDFIGTLHAVSLSDHSILWSSQTPLKQPAGLSLTIYEGKGFIGDTKGKVIAVNLDNGVVLWSAEMPKRVTSNIVVDNDLAYIWSDGVIYSLSIIDGSEAGTPFSGAATPPLVTDGRIYYGSNRNKLLVYNTGNSELLYEYELNSSITTRPQKVGSFIVVGLESGEIAIINEEAFNL